MGRYVDGYVLPVPTDAVDEYREIASEAGERWMEHGALEYYEGAGDDLDPDVGDVEMATFPEMVEITSEETVVFAFIVFESREHRDEVNAAVMEEHEGNDPDRGDEAMPFDVERMVYGGFESLVDYGG